MISASVVVVVVIANDTKDVPFATAGDSLLLLLLGSWHVQVGLL